MDKWVHLPKVELHRHLEGSISFGTLWELSEDLKDLSEEEARKLALTYAPSSGLAAILETFWRGQKLMNTPERIERITYEACRDAAVDGVTILELRYQPSFIQIGHSHLSFAVIHESVVQGVSRAEKDFPRLCVGLIGIIGRNLTKEIAEETTNFILEHRETFVGVDLANVEIGNCCKNFAPMFQRLHEAGVAITGSYKLVGAMLVRSDHSLSSSRRRRRPRNDKGRSGTPARQAHWPRDSSGEVRKCDELPP